SGGRSADHPALPGGEWRERGRPQEQAGRTRAAAMRASVVVRGGGAAQCLEALVSGEPPVLQKAQPARLVLEISGRGRAETSPAGLRCQFEPVAPGLDERLLGQGAAKPALLQRLPDAQWPLAARDTAAHQHARIA